MKGDRGKRLEHFHEAVQSLKLYRRAELLGEDKSLIEELYVDPLPEEQIFRTILKPNTTFLIGRKGTGKSTIFQRLQHELLKNKGRTSAYVDIKTVFESSQIDPQLHEQLRQQGVALPQVVLERLLLYKAFLRAVIAEIKSELRKRAQTSLWERVKSAFGGNLDELFEDLDSLLAEADTDRFTSVLSVKKVGASSKTQKTSKHTTKTAASGNLGVDSKASIGLDHTREGEVSSADDIQYADVLMRVFDIKSLMLKLAEILEKLGVRHLYVLVDDFSELPEDAMRVVVDALLAPLNNWSDEFIKFKIAAYPGRVYYGQIDKTKVDEIYLDIFRLYGTSDVATMEEKATDFTRRLVERRLEYYKAGTCPGIL